MDTGLAGFSPGLEVLPAHPSLSAFLLSFFYIFIRAACVFRTGETTQESPMLAKKKTINLFGLVPSVQKKMSALSLRPERDRPAPRLTDLLIE